MDKGQVDSFLERLKSNGYSSPAGQHWAAFYDLLAQHAQRTGVSRPFAPLILAASGESDSSKHYRLAEQLRWAEANGVLADALRFLTALQPNQWNQGSAESWHRSSYGE